MIGPAETVRAELERQIGELGINYLILCLIFGTLPFERAPHTLDRFAGEMM